MSERISLQPVFVLHSKPYRDTSLLVELFTLNHGRIHVLARNARGVRSRFRGLLQPFVPFLASWSGKSDLGNLSLAEPNGAPYLLTGTALISGFYLNELLVRLLYRHDPHPQLFMTYQQTLINLQRGDDAEATLRMFELEMLTELGYGVELDKEADTGLNIEVWGWYRFNHEHGFIRCEDVQAGSEQQRSLFSGKCLLALKAKRLSDKDDLSAAKRLMRIVLAPLLGDKPIRSRELFVSEKIG